MSSSKRKQRYDRKMRFSTGSDGTPNQTHVRMDFYVRMADKDQIKRIMQEYGRRDIIEVLLANYNEGGGGELCDCGHRAWRTLAANVLDLLDVERRTAHRHGASSPALQIRRRVCRGDGMPMTTQAHLP